MSKSNSNKKTNFNELSPINKKENKEKLTQPSLNNTIKQNSSNKQPGIIEVYEDNFIPEIKKISNDVKPVPTPMPATPPAPHRRSAWDNPQNP